MFRIVLCNIESYPLVDFKNIWSKDFGRVPWTKNKFLEMELYHYGTLLGFELDLHWKGQDHAGPSLEVSFLTLTFGIRIYDCRHWNHDTDNWMTEEETKEELRQWEERQKAHVT